MYKITLVFVSLLFVLMVPVMSACAKTVTLDDSRAAAETFIKAEATYKFDGMPETLKLTDTTAQQNGWEFTYEYDSAHAGYGDRTGQMLAQVITQHIALVTVENGKVKSAVMDNYWNMKTQQALKEVEIALAPIEEVTVSLLKSNPPQINVHIKGGLSSGCTTFHDIVVTREGNTVNIKVTVQHPKDMFCPAIYTTFEKDVNLGSDFAMGTYTLNINDFTTTFNY
jgi:hypothetical protein